MEKTKQLTPEERIMRIDKFNEQFVSPDSILILHEKHGDVHVAIPTVEVLYAAALQIVKSRFAEGWYCEPEKPEDPEISLDEIERTINTAVQAVLREEANKYQRNLKQYNVDQAEYDRILDAVKNEDGRLAWPIIRDHNDYEYEGWEIVELTKVEEI
jgi:hypothetical protein